MASWERDEVESALLASYFAGELSPWRRQQLEQWLFADFRRAQETAAWRVRWVDASMLPGSRRVDSMWRSLRQEMYVTTVRPPLRLLQPSGPSPHPPPMLGSTGNVAMVAVLAAIAIACGAGIRTVLRQLPRDPVTTSATPAYRFPF